MVWNFQLVKSVPASSTAGLNEEHPTIRIAIGSNSVYLPQEILRHPTSLLYTIRRFAKKFAAGHHGNGIRFAMRVFSYNVRPYPYLPGVEANLQNSGGLRQGRDGKSGSRMND